MSKGTMERAGRRGMGRGAVWVGLWLGCWGGAAAQDMAQSLAVMTVVGSKEDVWGMAGAAAYVDVAEIREQGLPNVNHVLGKVPGVYVREEDGFGNFPNISLRGADGTRSEKVTVMEDGVLAAPAPYSAPAAYYTPRVGRMSGVEVLKGSSQVKYGPQTTGGVINYLSTPVPEEATGYLRSTYGDHGTWLGHGYWGDTVETEAGRVGYLLELFGQVSDGFREIPGSGRGTGFELFEPMLKVVWEPATALRQRLEFKAGYTSFEADETYLGLTEMDVRINPDGRYAASAFDHMDSTNWRSYLKWTAEPTDDLRLESAAYFNRFERNWYKLDRAKFGATPARALHQVLAEPAYANELGVVRGVLPGMIEVKANNRAYDSYGWQNQAVYAFEAAGLEHEVSAGLRLHHDNQRRNHWLDRYAGNGAGGFSPIPGQSFITAGQDDRLEEVTALAVYVEDEIRFGKWTLRPGLRHEWLDMKYTNFAAPAQNREGDEELWMGGSAATYEIGENDTLYGGIYRGVSSPSPQAVLVNGVEEEESIGYELGWRHRREALAGELTAFFTDFDNLISTDNGLGLGGIATQNAGAAEVWGFEGALTYDPGAAHEWGFGLPVDVSATWTSAEFKDTTAGLAGGGDNIYEGGRAGNEIPYLPEWKLGAGIGLVFENWGLRLDASYVSSTWGTGYNGQPRAGVQTSRDGKIDSLLLVDFAAHYRVCENFTLLAGVQNIFDERGIVSRIPEGPRANAPRMIYAGFEANF